MKWFRSMTKIGSVLLGIGTVGRAIAEVVAPELVPVAEAVIGIGVAIGGVGLRNAISKNGAGK